MVKFEHNIWAKLNMLTVNFVTRLAVNYVTGLANYVNYVTRFVWATSQGWLDHH